MGIILSCIRCIMRMFGGVFARRKSRQVSAMDAEMLQRQEEHRQRVADRHGCGTWEEVQPTLNDGVIAPTAQLARALLEHLRCIVCGRVAYDPIETFCCDHVICLECSVQCSALCLCSPRNRCPYCHNHRILFSNNSKLAKRMIAACPGKCPFCRLIMPQTCLEDHKTHCQEGPHICLVCATDSIPKKDLSNHWQEIHPEYYLEFKSRIEHEKINPCRLNSQLLRKYRTRYPPLTDGL